MTSSLKYAAVGTAVVGVVVLLSWPFLDLAGRRGVLVAAVVALPVQVVSFALMQSMRHQLKRFLAAWVGGTLIRMAVIGGVALVAVRSGTEGVVPMLLALASFFFGLLLLEPLYFGAGRKESG